MSILEGLFSARQYSIPAERKAELLVSELSFLTDFHENRCIPYANILHSGYFDGWREARSIESLPFLPVQLFKTLDLTSVAKEDVIKTLTSSGTTSSIVSKISVDKETALLQSKALVSIVSSYIGTKRLPMVIVDSQSVIKSRDSMSARGAGLVGLANFGRDHFYALDETMKLDINGLLSYVDRWNDQPILIFGFTFMVWQYFVSVLVENNIVLDMPKAFLIHSGGWKKMLENAVTNSVFRETIRRQCGITSVYNFYGMVEQVGSIYMECENGYFHAPNFADILIRDHIDWSVVPPGRQGIIQTLSVLPRSYPGHSLLTEDVGTVHGVDDCPCGRKGTYFSVDGRIPEAELRGCSDTHAQSLLAMQN